MKRNNNRPVNFSKIIAMATAALADQELRVFSIQPFLGVHVAPFSNIQKIREIHNQMKFTNRFGFVFVVIKEERERGGRRN